MEQKTYKCGFIHCHHELKDISADIAVKDGARWFHPDCSNTRNNIRSIEKIYFEEVSNTVVIAMLRKVINNIVFQKHVDSVYLLFALRFSINKNFKISSPMGLHYIVDNRFIKEAWQKKEAERVVEQMKFDNCSIQEVDTSFTFKASKPTGFGKITRGGM